MKEDKSKDTDEAPDNLNYTLVLHCQIYNSAKQAVSECLFTHIKLQKELFREKKKTFDQKKQNNQQQIDIVHMTQEGETCLYHSLNFHSCLHIGHCCCTCWEFSHFKMQCMWKQWEHWPHTSGQSSPGTLPETHVHIL